jgi:hypothetical protein
MMASMTLHRRDERVEIGAMRSGVFARRQHAVTLVSVWIDPVSAGRRVQPHAPDRPASVGDAADRFPNGAMLSYAACADSCSSSLSDAVSMSIRSTSCSSRAS